MVMIEMLLFTLLCALTTFAEGRDSPPTWPAKYTVGGTLQLPYAELDEPFMAYFDSTANKSKISYYEGTMTTYQFGSNSKTPYGVSYKVAPMTTETVMNERACFEVAGSQDAPMAAQSVLPDLTGFSLMKSNNDEGLQVWQMIQWNGHKKNTYTMTVKAANGDGGAWVPVRYEMFGYDSLLGSHYDKYYLDYFNFLPDVSDDEFDLPSDLKCGGFPGPGDSEHAISMNPMREFIHGDDSHVDEMFDHFKHKHSKRYQDDVEHERRKHAFRHNLRFINSKNRQGLSYRLAVNHMADMNGIELKRMRGYVNSRTPNNAEAFSTTDRKLRYMPQTVDWRLYGAVTPVKDQAVCGSCWSFGTTGTIEGAYFLKTGELVRLSQQELMDCSWGEGNNACDGGEDFRAYQWILKHGLATSDDYGPYQAIDSYCREDNVTSRVHIKGYKNVTSGDADALKLAIAQEGPVSVAIDAAHMSFVFYSNGVYYEPQCGNTPDDLDHAVLAVGYGVLDGKAYWLVKNSWSTYWGNDGYVLMAQKDNNCGVMTDPTFVTL